MYSNSDFKILDFGGFYLFISPTGVLDCGTKLTNSHHIVPNSLAQ